MVVTSSYLNSLDFRPVYEPFGVEYDGYRYVRKYAVGDVIHAQLLAAGAVLSLGVRAYIRDVDGTGRPIPAEVAQRGSVRVVDIVFVVGETSILPLPGMYYLYAEVFDRDSTALLHSEPFCASQPPSEPSEPSVLIRAQGSANAFGAYFDTVLGKNFFEYRVEGGFYQGSLTPGSSDTIYEAQQARHDMLYSMPYDTRRLVLGGARGIPDGFIQKLNRALSCDALAVDGVPYGKIEGSKLEAVGSERYPFRSWAIELKDKQDPFAFSSANGVQKVTRGTWGDFVEAWSGYLTTNSGDPITTNGGDMFALSSSAAKLLVASTFTFYQTVYGNPLYGTIPEVTSVTDAFEYTENYLTISYPRITLDAWAKYSDMQRQDRLILFKKYLDDATGFKIDAIQTNQPEIGVA